MRLILQVHWIGMAGMGPSAWNRDSKILAMHTPHHHEGQGAHNNNSRMAGQYILDMSRPSASGRRQTDGAESKIVLKV